VQNAHEDDYIPNNFDADPVVANPDTVLGIVAAQFAETQDVPQLAGLFGVRNRLFHPAQERLLPNLFQISGETGFKGDFHA
jgi:hypothetical protein